MFERVLNAPLVDAGKYKLLGCINSCSIILVSSTVLRNSLFCFPRIAKRCAGDRVDIKYNDFIEQIESDNLEYFTLWLASSVARLYLSLKTSNCQS